MKIVINFKLTLNIPIIIKKNKEKCENEAVQKTFS